MYTAGGDAHSWDILFIKDKSPYSPPPKKTTFSVRPFECGGGGGEKNNGTIDMILIYSGAKVSLWPYVGIN